MQDRALALMGKKLTAAQALEGKFSSEGLVAMAGEDANVEIALARSLVERIDEGDARRFCVPREGHSHVATTRTPVSEVRIATHRHQPTLFDAPV